MVAVYVSLIQKGLRTIEQVPTLWREQVQRELKE
ncbi:CD1375 family protein [Alkaliphilus crotonatoxidans]